MRKFDNRLKGETWYYTPCGKRIKQFPEVIKVKFNTFCISDMKLLNSQS